jgi:membrane fusion protein (multidrug efflux system)
LIDKGGYAQKGDTIAILDNDVLKANAAAAKAKYELAQVTYEKQAQIFKDNVNSEIQVLEAKLNRDAAKANYELVKAQLDDTYLVAGFSGVVDSKYFEVGELAGPGMPIVNLINISKIKIEAGLPEKHVGKVKIGAPVKIYVKSISKEPIDGIVSYVGNSVSVNNRTLPIEILINNRNNSLKPELVAELYIQNKKYEKVILVPEEVVSRVDYGYEVFVESEGKAVSREIQIINRFEDKVAVSSGLTEGENLIVVGYQNLINGQLVKVVN